MTHSAIAAGGATVYVIAARRTPVARVGGPLRTLRPERLAAPLLRTIVFDNLRADPSVVDDVLLGNALGPGGNLARLALLEAGLPVTVPGGTVDRQCGSGLSSILLAASMIRAGDAAVVLAGGVESASRAPWKMERPTSLYGGQLPRFIERTPFAPSDIGDPSMGEAAENVAVQFGISREDQDDFAVESHRRFGVAVKEGRLAAELVPLELEDGGIITEDEGARGASAMAAEERKVHAFRQRLATLGPVFRAGGTVTAGNSCGVHDGAAVVALASETAVRAHGWQPFAVLRTGATVGVDPQILGIGPAPALERCLQRVGLDVDSLDRVEINEAFACQVLACARRLSLAAEVVNPSGGALALGHPYGASGAIILVRLVHEMRQRGLRRGAAAIGMAGGLGAAVIVESVD